VNDISRLFQAFLAPALFVSATALLILSINVRLMGIVSRLRQYVHAKHDATKNGRLAEADAYTEQIRSIEKRAELIRRCFLLALVSLAGAIASCLLLGFGLYWPQAAVMSAIVFVVAMISLFAAACYYLREVNVALSSVRDEAHDERFMDIAVSSEIRGSHHV
jgi:Protein of unknown function (DUF2721)